MGFGSDRPQKKVFYCSMLATKDKKVAPHFKVQTRENNKTVSLNDEFEVSGYLTHIKHDKYEYPKDSGIMIPTIEMWLVDKAAIFKVSSSLNTGMARTLINRIVSIDKGWGWITLRVYEKDGFANLYVANDDQSMSWKFDYKKDLEPLVRESENPQQPGKMMKIYHAVNEKLLNEWTKTEKLVLENAKASKVISDEIKIGETKAGDTPESAPSQDNKPLDDSDFTVPDNNENRPADDFVPPPPEDDLPF